METKEIIEGYWHFSSFGFGTSPHIECVFPTEGKPTQGWFDLFTVAENLDFQYNFNVNITRPDSVIYLEERKTHSLFVELGLIQLLIYAHPKMSEKIRTFATWQLYDNSPMMNGFFGNRKVKFQYGGNGLHELVFCPKKKTKITFLVY